MTPQFKVALIRGAIFGAILGGASFFAVAPVGGLVVGLYAAGASFFGTLATRAGIEGFIDTKAANSGS